MEFIEKIKLQPCKNNVIWRRNLRRTHVAQACFSLSFSFRFLLLLLWLTLARVQFQPLWKLVPYPAGQDPRESSPPDSNEVLSRPTAPPTGPFAHEKRIGPRPKRPIKLLLHVYVKKIWEAQRRRGRRRWWSSSHLREKSLSPLTFERVFSNNCYRTLAIRGDSRRCGNSEKRHRINEWIGIERLWSADI